MTLNDKRPLAQQNDWWKINKMADEKNMNQTADGYFPMFFNIAGKKILIAGGGNIALRRIHTLTEFHADITVMAPALKDEIRELFQKGEIHIVERGYQDEDADQLRDFFMVIAATDDSDLNRRICNAGKIQGILVNNASDKSQCDFYFPAIVKEGDVIAGVCAGGRDHRLVRRTAAGMRKWLKEFLE